MQPDLPFHIGPEPEAAPHQIEFVRMRLARRYILRVRTDGSLRITIPRGGSRAEALAFIERQLAWITRERARVGRDQLPPRWADGSAILLDGVSVAIRVTASPSGPIARYADRSVQVRDSADVRVDLERDLRDLAGERLVPRLHALAAAHGLTVSRVTIRNQRSRWGSCSRTGAIALNFRLVQMPAPVRDYVLIHELMHLRQQNHGRRFWALVEHACPEYRAAERWLRLSGRALF